MIILPMSLRNRIHVIATPTESELAEQKRQHENIENRPTIVEGKKYCPYDSRLLVYRGDIDSAYCGDCGYTENPQAAIIVKQQQAQQQKQGASISQESDTQTQNTESIDMQLIPMGMSKSRSIRQREQELSSDPDTRRMQEKGYIIMEQNITIREEGTFNVEEMRERQQKRSSILGNRFNSYSVSY